MKIQLNDKEYSLSKITPITFQPEIKIESFISKLNSFKKLYSFKILSNISELTLEKNEKVVEILGEDISENISKLNLDKFNWQEKYLYFLVDYLLKAKGDVFIYNPEGNLHILWQEVLVDSLTNIMNYNKNLKHVIYTTQSPFMLGDYGDNSIRLS